MRNYYILKYVIIILEGLFLSRKLPEVYLYNEADGLEKMRSFVDAADINRKE